MLGEATGHFAFWISLSPRLSLSSKVGLRPKISQKSEVVFRLDSAISLSEIAETKLRTEQSLNPKITRRWHVTISCQPDGRPPQPVRPWKSGRVHLAEGSNVVVLELPYSVEFGRESRKFGSGVRKYGKFDDGR